MIWDVSRAVCSKVAAQVLNQGVTILRIDRRSPLHHFVDLFCPRRLAKALLQDDAGFMTLGAGIGRFYLHRSGWEIGVPCP